MGSAGTERSFVGKQECFAVAGQHRPNRLHRPALIVAIALLMAIFLTGCGGGFFSHPTLSTMYVNPASATLTASNTTQLAAYGTYSDGSQSKINEKNVTWTSSDPSVATVSSSDGLVTGVAAGTATITATATIIVPGTGCQVLVSIANGSPQLSKVCYGTSTETLTSAINVNVTAGPVNRAVISTTEGSTVSQTTAATSGTPAILQFYAYANGDASNDVTQAVTWASSNPNVATISSGLPSGNGLVTGVAAGTTNITATTTNSTTGQVVNSQTVVLTVQ